jgi:hypothetical protein
MFLRSKSRLKDGKERRYWSVVENRRVSGDRVAQRQVLYLGEINDSQEVAWRKTIEVFDPEKDQHRQMQIFPVGREVSSVSTEEVVHVKISEVSVRRPRQWGACWLTCGLWDQLELDDFWRERLPVSRKGTRWLNVLKTMVAYRLISPGSEWELHRKWFLESALGDLLGEDFSVVEIHALYRCLDKLLPHKRDLFSYLRQRWETLFHPNFDILLYDLTSTYFECDPPEEGKRKYGYSRDKRPDCVQVVIALVVTTEGLPLAYEVMPGNTSDKTTLRDFVKKIEDQYGKANRIWVMDRGVPTEEALGEMRGSNPPISYLVGTPRGRLTKMEKAFLSLPWEKVRNEVDVKLLPQDGELYVLARSKGREHKERAMRRRKLKKLWKRLQELQAMKLSRDELLLKLGAVKKEAGQAYRLVSVSLPTKDQPVTKETFSFSLDRRKLRIARRKEGKYLLRSNLTAHDPALLWRCYILLTEVEQAFKNLKDDLSIRPIYHQKDDRIEAHIFVSFLAYCLHVTLRQRLRPLAPGLTPRAVLDKFAAIQMVDVHLPTTDGRELILSRYTQPENDQKILLNQLRLELPPQPPPKITTRGTIAA